MGEEPKTIKLYLLRSIHRFCRLAPPQRSLFSMEAVTAKRPLEDSADQAAAAAAEGKEIKKEIDSKEGSLKKQLKEGAPPESLDGLQAECAGLREKYQQVTGVEYHRNKRPKHRPKQDPLEPPPAADTFPAYEPRDFFKWEIVHKSTKPGSNARVGIIHTPHGDIHTPAFVPVATNGALKAVSGVEADETGVQLQFSNTYHLLVHPGVEVIEAAGGLHKFINRTGPIITDSGGFQVFSLDKVTTEDGPELKRKKKREGDENGGGSLLKVSEEGTQFRSYYDGKKIDLTPESTVQAQKKIGADIIIPLDELPPYHVSAERLRASVFLSHRWMARSLKEHLKDVKQQAMYAVVHGGTDKALRKESLDYLASLPFDGFAIGGSLGKDRDEMVDMLGWLMPQVPDTKPNHILGIADEKSIEALVPFGCDTFDACNPTRIARHGTLLTTDGQLRITQRKHLTDFGPIDPNLKTIPYSRAYLHHLFKQNEPLFLTLASVHNLYFMNNLMKTVRERIMKNEI